MEFWTVFVAADKALIRVLKWFKLYLIPLLGINIFVCQYGIVNILAICRPGNESVSFSRRWFPANEETGLRFRDNSNSASRRGKSFVKEIQIHFVSATKCSLCFHKVKEEKHIFFFSINRTVSARKDQTFFAHLETHISFLWQLLYVSAARKRDNLEPFPILWGWRCRRLRPQLPRQVATCSCVSFRLHHGCKPILSSLTAELLFKGSTSELFIQFYQLTAFEVMPVHFHFLHLSSAIKY